MGAPSGFIRVPAAHAAAVAVTSEATALLEGFRTWRHAAQAPSVFVEANVEAGPGTGGRGDGGGGEDARGAAAGSAGAAAEAAEAAALVGGGAAGSGAGDAHDTRIDETNARPVGAVRTIDESARRFMEPA